MNSLTAGQNKNRLDKHPFITGLFLPCLDGGWSISSAPRSTTYEFQYNRKLVNMVEDLDFDLIFQVGQWRPGYGGKIKYRDKTLEPMTTNAALAAVTSSCLLLTTSHILYRTHPLAVAKMGANIDHISGGRWGINVVAGFDELEYKAFGYEDLPGHDQRYEMADEFVTLMKLLWTSEEPVDFAGKYYSAKQAYISPKPIQNPYPVIVNAGISTQGRAFAAKHCDAIFVTNPVEGGPNPKDWSKLAEVVADIKQQAAALGRNIKTIINPHIICRETEEEAWQAYHQIVEAGDTEAAHNFLGHLTKGNKSWPLWDMAHYIVGGNVLLIGTPQQIVDQLLGLQQAGIDGIQITFFDYVPDIERFGRLVLPLMREAGLRH